VKVCRPKRSKLKRKGAPVKRALENPMAVSIISSEFFQAYYNARVRHLRWRGDQGSGRCPFHDDRRPSFSVNRETGRWQCFSGKCGHKGDIFAFEMLISGCDFRTAQRRVLADLGVPMDDNSYPILTLKALAQAKRLPVEFLSGLGVRDVVGLHGQQQGVLSAYRMEDGSLSKRAHHRKHLSHEPEFWTWWTGSKDDDIVPYGLWRLQEARDAGYIIITEGDSDAWTLWHHGIPALSVPGAKMIKVLEPGYLKGISKAYIVRHGDESGEAFVQGVLERLQPWPGQAFVVRALEFKDVNDLHCDDPEKFADRWAKVLEAAVPAGQRVEAGEPPPPQPQLEPQWPGDPDPAIYQGLAGEYVRAVQPYTESDPIGLVVQFLLSFGNAIGRNAYFLIDADRHYTQEFAVLCGVTSKSRKGTSAGRVRSLYQKCDPDCCDWCRGSGLSSGEGLIWRLRDAIFNAKGKLVDEGVSDKRLYVVEPEFSSALRMVERPGNILSQTVREFWDGLHIIGKMVSERTRPSATTTDAHVSIVGHITLDEVQRYLTTTEVGNGFANRFWWFMIRRFQFLPHGGDLDECDRALDPVVEKLKAVIAFGRQERKLLRGADAYREWEGIYRSLSDGKRGLAGAVASRSETHVTRVSSLYALLDRSGQIQPAHQEAALALWQYSEKCCRYIFGDALGDPVADAILKAVRATLNGLTLTDVHNLFGRNKPAAVIARAVDALLALGLIRAESQTTEGRTATVFLAV
jgi:hypothetical protein